MGMKAESLSDGGEWQINFQRSQDGKGGVELVAYRISGVGEGFVLFGMSPEGADALLTEGRTVLADVLFPPYVSPADQGADEVSVG